MKINLFKVFSIAVIIAMAFGFVPMHIQSVTAISPNIVISQVYGGGGNTGATYTHDFVELFNRGTTAVSLTGWSIQYTSATGTGAFGASATTLTELPDVLVQPGQYYLVQEAQGAGGTTALPTPDLIDATPIAISGTGAKVALVNTTASLGCNGSSLPCSIDQMAMIIDLVGWGTANFYEGTAAAPVTTNTTSISRIGNGCTETDENSTDFTAGAPNPRNTATTLNVCPVVETAPSVSSTTPASAATNISISSNIVINFSEPVDVTGSWYSVSCATSGEHTAVVSGGPSSFTLDPDSDFSNSEECTVTVLAANITDQDTNDPPDNMAADHSFTFQTEEDYCAAAYTPIYEVQGSGASSPLTGNTVDVEGVVVGDFQNNTAIDNGNLNGFHLQDPTGDADRLTSDGIFIYAPGGMDVALGDAVRVRGSVSEYNGMTEITASQIWVCSTGNSVAATPLSLPVTAVDDFEAYEGMLVTFPQPLVISEYFNYDRYGEIVLTSERHLTPTAEFEPGSDEYYQAVQEFLLDKITLDDGRSTQNPDPAIHPNGSVFDLTNLFRGGDLVTNVTGVLDYSFSLYRIQPTQGADTTSVNPRTELPDDVGGTLKVVSMNTLNYFTTIDTGAYICGPNEDLECRGADTPEEFTRQHDKLVAAITAMDADVVGLIEIENNVSDAPIQTLVDGLNSVMGAGTYDYVRTGAIGSDAIRAALIYKPASVSLLGDFALLDSSVDARFLDGKNRPVLAQSFMDNNGGIFTVAVNHLKSKGSDCNDVGDPDLGDGAGNCNLTRMSAAQALVDWLATDPTNSGDDDFLIIGDLNSYDKEDPIDAIRAGADDVLGTADDYLDMTFEFEGESAYSYVYDGQIGYLDYALGGASMFDQVTGLTVWHVNADEPDLIDYDMTFKLDAQDALYAADEYRYSDHDPVIIGLDLLSDAAPMVDAGGPYTFIEGKTIGIYIAAEGYDPNGDYLSYAWDLDNNGSFETPGQTVLFSANLPPAPTTFIISVQVTNSLGLTAVDSTTVDVIYDFSGFFSPVKNPQILNIVKAGYVVPLKFSLGGDRGLDILMEGYPLVEEIACPVNAIKNKIEDSVKLTDPLLTYKPAKEQYKYTWATSKEWAGSCRVLTLMLDDGTIHQAYFKFK